MMIEDKYGNNLKNNINNILFQIKKYGMII